MNESFHHLSRAQRSLINQRAAELALQITPDVRDLLVRRLLDDFGAHELRGAFLSDMLTSVASVTVEDVAEYLLSEGLG